MNKNYENEACSRWGNTDAYRIIIFKPSPDLSCPLFPCTTCVKVG